MRLLVVRVLAVLCALTWLVFPGFGLIDLSVTWDRDWPVVLEAGWGVFMTVLVGGSFLAIAVRPTRASPATATLLVTLATWLVAAAAGLEWPLLGYVALLALQLLLVLLVPGRERFQPVAWSVSRPMLVLAVLGIVPWLLHAERMFASNRRNAGVLIGDVTMGVDHYAVQGALALALVALPLMAACWPRGRRYLGASAGLCAAYVGLVSFAFPSTWGGLGLLWSVLAMTWGAAIAVLATAAPRLQARQFGRQVVEAERAQ